MNVASRLGRLERRLQPEPDLVAEAWHLLHRLAAGEPVGATPTAQALLASRFGRFLGDIGFGLKTARAQASLASSAHEGLRLDEEGADTMSQ